MNRQTNMNEAQMQQRIEELEKKLAHYENNCTIVWMADDVLTLDKTLNEEEVSWVLERMQHKHDATLGINWDTIAFWISEVKPLALEGEGIELSDGGIILYPDNSGTIERYDGTGDRMETRNPDHPDYEEWNELMGDKAWTGDESEEKEMMDLLTKGKVALKQFVAYDDRDFKDFCKEEDLDYNDPNVLQKYVETYDDVALIEMLKDDEQGRYYELMGDKGDEQ